MIQPDCSNSCVSYQSYFRSGDWKYIGGFLANCLDLVLLATPPVDGGAAIVGRWNGTPVSGVPKFANCKGASNQDVTFEFLRRKL